MSTDQGLLAVALVLWGLSLAWLVATALCAALQPVRRRRLADLPEGQPQEGELQLTPQSEDEGVPVSIIVPTSTFDSDHAARDRQAALASIALLVPAAREVILSVDRGRDDDPFVARLRAVHAGCQVIVAPARLQASPNGKIDAMAAGVERARHDHLVFFDDDVELDRDCLARLLAQLRNGVGLVSAAAIGTAPANFAADVELAFMNGQFARLHLAGDVLGYSGALGKALLMRRADLARAGGVLPAGGDCCEDAGLTRNVKACGLGVALSDQPVRQPIGAQRLGDVWRRHRRWLSCRRRYLPVVFVCEALFSTPVSCLAGAVVAAQLIGTATTGILLTAALWLAADLLLAAVKGWPLSWRSPLAWLVREAIFLPMWASALWARTVLWHGRTVPVVAQPSD